MRAPHMAEFTQVFFPLKGICRLRNVFTVGGIALAFLFLMKRLRCSDMDVSYYADIRKCQELKCALENTRIKRLVIERRVEDHFAFFCLSDTIRTDIPQKYLSVANSNERGSGACTSSISASLVLMLLSAVITLVVATYLFKCEALKPETAGLLDFVSGAVVVFLFIFAMIGVQSVASKLFEERKSCEKRIKKLGNTLGKEDKRYVNILKSLELYHSLEEHIRRDIRTSERFAPLVKGKILAGILTASCCEKIVRELERINSEQESVALYA